MNVNEYLVKQYTRPGCWCLVTDVYVNELDLRLKNYQVADTSLRSISEAFRIELHRNQHGFVKVDSPSNYSVVLMAKFAGQNPHHAGIWYEGKVLHNVPLGNLYQDISSLSDQFKHVEYWDKL